MLILLFFRLQHCCRSNGQQYLCISNASSLCGCGFGKSIPIYWLGSPSIGTRGTRVAPTAQRQVSSASCLPICDFLERRLARTQQHHPTTKTTKIKCARTCQIGEYAAHSWDFAELAARRHARRAGAPNHRPTPVPICLGQIVWIIILASTSNKKSWLATAKENKTGNCDAQLSWNRTMGFYDGNSLWMDAIALCIIQVLLIVTISRTTSQHGNPLVIYYLLDQTVNDVDEPKFKGAKTWILNKVSFSPRTRNTAAPSSRGRQRRGHCDCCMAQQVSLSA